MNEKKGAEGENDPEKKTIFRRKFRESCVNLTSERERELILLASCAYADKKKWYNKKEHHWYQCSRPEGSLAHGFKRRDQTFLAHFRIQGSKSFEMCTNCSSKPSSPAHILKCLGLTKQELADNPLLEDPLLFFGAKKRQIEGFQKGVNDEKLLESACVSEGDEMDVSQR
ncbi:uncharacterized protein TNCV_3710861 [Trichonephila clavipes]|uniref:Uncharacterized protein n=1 Tax=Trichonephila clavipes TaxID=2585209 RepID=A0A8X6V1F6_TRICX|nr:uncharacterized protein TNCV_3710861 [Trichonephila clavipes]